MTMSRPVFAAVVALLAACAGVQKTTLQDAPTGPRPNIILILADDQAPWAISAYGKSEVETPNIDKLAAQGALFANAFATSPVCTPSRLNVVTGMESVEVGTLNDPTSRRENIPLPYGAPSWARELKAHGYRTGFVGKWDLGPPPENSPTRYGYDYFYGFRAGANLARDPFLASGEEKHRRVEGFTDDVLTDHALAFLDSVGNKPFALSLNTRGPHLPYLPQPDEDIKAVQDIDPAVPALGEPGINGEKMESVESMVAFVKQQRKEYYAAVHNVDRNIGRLMQALEDRGLAENTIVIYTSDNGYLLGDRGLFNKGPAAPLSYDMFPDKRRLWVINLFDLSLRVPMVVRWPGVVTPGTEVDGFVTLLDLYPTILSMAGVPMPEGDVPTAGKDFSVLLKNSEVAWRDAVFGQYTSDRIGNTEYLRMIRTDKWKLVISYLNPSSNELYDLENDPSELDNLYYPKRRLTPNPDGTFEFKEQPDCCAQVRTDLEKRLREWQASIDDPALELEKRYEGHKKRALERWRN